MCIVIYIYKALTIIASQDCNLTHFVYLERVDKLCIHSDRHLYCGDSVIQSKVVDIDSLSSLPSKKNEYP